MISAAFWSAARRLVTVHFTEEKMMRIIRVALLVMALAVPVFAGDMHCGVTAAGNIPFGITATGEMQNGVTVADDIPNGVTVAGDIPFDVTLLSLLTLILA
jgi:hypothetical protein